MKGKIPSDHMVRAYSDRVAAYGREENLQSCWGIATRKAFANLRIDRRYRQILDIGCGTGEELRRLADLAGPSTSIIGVEPAWAMRDRAERTLRELDNVRVVDGRFEDIPMSDASVDYLVSLMAFHWVVDPESAVLEMRRVIKPGGQLDIVFAGRRTGHEFTKLLTPIFLKVMGPRKLLEAARLRRQFDLDGTRDLFAKAFPLSKLVVQETLKTYYSDLEGHWAWWIARAEGQVEAVPAEHRAACDAAVRAAMQSLQEYRGIPYTVHTLHVRLLS